MIEKVVMSKIVKFQKKETESTILAIEKKRMKLDERMIEMKERHWQQQQEGKE